MHLVVENTFVRMFGIILNPGLYATARGVHALYRDSIFAPVSDLQEVIV